MAKHHFPPFVFEDEHGQVINGISVSSDDTPAMAFREPEYNDVFPDGAEGRGSQEWRARSQK